jgi:N-methylhydantoinase A/oxoprolinase/acetone carboxylase beta subunit
MCLFVFEFQINRFLSSQSDSKTKPAMTAEDVAMGFIQVANEAMCRPIRALTQVQFHASYLMCFYQYHLQITLFKQQ